MSAEFEMIEEPELESSESIDSDSSSQILNRLETTDSSRQRHSRSKSERYPWHPRFLTQFSWLEYDERNKTAKCKLKYCKAYYNL
jgi:hypothetical protein